MQPGYKSEAASDVQHKSKQMSYINNAEASFIWQEAETVDGNY